jgi:hypothetical protein
VPPPANPARDANHRNRWKSPALWRKCKTKSVGPDCGFACCRRPMRDTHPILAALEHIRDEAQDDLSPEPLCDNV